MKESIMETAVEQPAKQNPLILNGLGKKETDYISVVISSIVHPKKEEIEAFMRSVGYKKSGTTGMGGGKVQMHFSKDAS
jgi:hypothetical protein